MADVQNGKQSNQYPQDDVLMNVDVNVPYDQNVAGDAQDTLWDNMTNALKPDLTPNKNKGNGVLGTMDVNQGGSAGGSKKQG